MLKRTITCLVLTTGLDPLDSGEKIHKLINRFASWFKSSVKVNRLYPTLKKPSSSIITL